MAEEQEIIYRIRVVGDDEGKSKLASLESQLASVGKQRAELIKKAKEGQQLDKTEASNLERLNKEYVSLTQQKRSYNSEVNRAVKQAAAEVGSLAEMRANISQMRAEYEKLAPASEKGKQLAGSIALLQTEINNANFATKNFTGNVGNYAGAADMVIESTTKNYRELRAEIKALQSVSFAGKSDEEIKQINTRIGELKDSMADLAAIQKASGLEFGAALAGSLQVGTAAVEGFVGTLNVLGVESETVGELQKKMVDLIGVTQALGVIEDALQKKTLITTATKIKDTVATTAATVANWANVTSTTAQTNATAAMAVITGQATIGAKAAAAAQWLWNAAILANPIVAIVAAVAALTAGIVYLASSQSEAAEKADRLRGEISRLNAERERSEASMDYELKYAAALGTTTAELLKMEVAQNAVRQASLLMEQQRIKELMSTGKATRDEFHRYVAINKDIQSIRESTSIAYAKIRKTEADEAAKANEEQLKAEEALQAERAKRAEEKRKADADAAIEAQAIRIETAKALEKELDDAIEEDRKEREAIRLEENPIEEDPTYLRRLAAVDAETAYFADKWGSTYEGQLQALRGKYNAGLMLEKEYNDRVKAVNDKQVEVVKQQERAKMQAASDTFATIASAFGEQTAAFKIAASAQTIINTFQAAQTAYLRGLEVPIVGLALGPIAMGAAIAVGLQNLAQINGVKFATGVIGLDGPGTATSDSIPAHLSRGESVMTAKATAAFAPQLADMELAVGNKPNYQLKRYYATGVIGAGSSTARQTDQDLGRLIQEAVRGVASIPVVVSAGRVRDKVREVEVIDREGDL